MSTQSTLFDIPVLRPKIDSEWRLKLYESFGGEILFHEVKPVIWLVKAMWQNGVVISRKDADDVFRCHKWEYFFRNYVEITED